MSLTFGSSALCTRYRFGGSRVQVRPPLLAVTGRTTVVTTTKRPGATNATETRAATRARTRRYKLMATPNATRDDDSAEINDRTFAAYMVIEEHDRLAEATMALLGVIGDIQAGREDVRLLKVENMRKAAARTLYKSRRNLTAGLLFAVSIDDKAPLDEKVIDAIAKSGDEAGEHYERLDAEIKSDAEIEAEKGEDR